MQISTPPHRQLQQRISRNHIRRILSLFHPVVEGPHLVPLPRSLVVTVIHIVLKCIIRRIRRDHLQHLFRDWDMNGCPNRVSHINIVTELSPTQHSVEIRLVVTCPHHRPRAGIYRIRALNDRIVLHLIPSNVHRNALVVQRAVDDVGVGKAGRRRLERRRNPCSRIR